MIKTPLNHPALLPVGMRDVLPPEAELEARSVETIMDCFAAHGYQRVKTPLMEFEETLFAGAGAATAEQTFRLMDPESQRMVGLRADITPQISRLASMRLGAAPRPLRLAYAGQCLRVGGSQLQLERQVAQVGIELIGPDSATADAEIILTAAEALTAIGLKNSSFDLTVPRLVLSLLDGVNPEYLPLLTRALDRKDSAAVADLGGPLAPLLLKLLQVAGSADRAMPALLALDLPSAAKAHAVRLAEAVSAIQASNPEITLTVDPVEFRGYQYHTGICVTIFAPGQQAELGRGGRYLCGETEPATGITLYPDTIVGFAPAPDLRKRLYLPFGTASSVAFVFRGENFATVQALTQTDDPFSEAAKLSCGYVFFNGKIVAVSKDPK